MLCGKISFVNRKKPWTPYGISITPRPVIFQGILHSRFLSLTFSLSLRSAFWSNQNQGCKKPVHFSLTPSLHNNYDSSRQGTTNASKSLLYKQGLLCKNPQRTLSFEPCRVRCSPANPSNPLASGQQPTPSKNTYTPQNKKSPARKARPAKLKPYPPTQNPARSVPQRRGSHSSLAQGARKAVSRSYAKARRPRHRDPRRREQGRWRGWGLRAE